MNWMDITLKEIAYIRFVKEIDIYNNKIYLWFVQLPEKVDQIAADVSWPNAFSGNETKSISVSTYQLTSLLAKWYC